MFRRLRKYLEEFVYAGMDGSVTTFAIVAGAAGAGLSSQVVLILGFANLLADGFSMSVGAYLSAKSERENMLKHRKTEMKEIIENPASEEDEIRTIYRRKGFSGELLEKVVQTIIRDKSRWVDEMMKDELHLIEEKKTPFKKGLSTYISFILVGLFPLGAYLVDLADPLLPSALFPISTCMTILAFIIIGALKGQLNNANLLRSISETAILGIVAALFAYVTGTLLKELINGRPA